MEEPKKTLDHQDRKKPAIKIGAGSSIGAVLLLGGTLATAAFVSAFVRKRGWRSGKNNDRRHQNKNPPPESGKQDELDGTKKGEQFVVLDKSSRADKHHQRNGETEVIEPVNITDSLKQDVKKVRFEINGGDSVIPIVEIEVVCDSPVVVDEEGFHSQGENLPEDTVPQGITKLPLIENDESNEITTGTKDFDTNCEPDPDENNVNGQENDSAQDKSEVVIDKIVDGVADCLIQDVISGEDGQTDVVPLLDIPVVVEHQVVNGNEEEGALTANVVEIVQVDEVVEGSHGDGMGCGKDEVVEKQEKSDQKPVDVIVLESCVGEAYASNSQINDVQILAPRKEIDCENIEENACTSNQVVESHISCEVGTEEDGDVINEAVAENREVNEDAGLDRSTRKEIVEAEIAEVKENGASEEVEAIDSDIPTAKDNVIMPTNNANNEDSNNVAEESSVETGMQEVDCKIPEDAADTKEDENGSSFRPNGVQIEEHKSKTKYVVNLAKLKGRHTAKPSRRAMVITVLSMLSSFSCYWFLGVSLVKLCAVLFLTMALSKI